MPFKIPTVEEIREARKKRLVIGVLSVYGDESYDGKRKRVCAVAGIIGHQGEWDNLEPLWLKCTKGKIIHPTDDEFRGDYKLILKLAKLLAETNMIGYAFAIDLATHKQYFPNSNRNMPYYYGFEAVVHFMGNLAALHVPSQKVEFIFHRNYEIEYNAGSLYHCMLNDPTWKSAKYLANKVSFADNSDIRIQAACLFAREIMKHFDIRISKMNRYPRLAIGTLFNTKRYDYDYYTKNDFKQLEDEMIYCESKASLRELYDKWLLRKRRIDNASNMLEFLHTGIKTGEIPKSMYIKEE